MRLMVYEGTPEEISQVAANLQPVLALQLPFAFEVGFSRCGLVSASP